MKKKIIALKMKKKIKMEKINNDDKLNLIFEKYIPLLGEINIDLAESDVSLSCSLIFVFWKRLLMEWTNELECRSEKEKNNPHGRMESSTLKQTSEYLKPFFKHLKKKTLPRDIHIAEISFWTHRKEYVEANDAYLRLSIGNAPWPMGVGAVNFHERASDCKIMDNQIAHALNDETTRKWIQSIKRLITFSQKKYPPDSFAKIVG
jgi:pre-mRNA-splicing factor 18